MSQQTTDAIQQAMVQLMSDPRVAAQVATASLYNIAVTELVMAGMPSQECHAMIDVALDHGMPTNTAEMSPWIFLLAYATVKWQGLGATRQELHQAVEGMVQQATQFMELAKKVRVG